MMEAGVILFLGFILLCALSENSEITSSVPDVLQTCYRRNFSVISRPPLTMQLLIEMLRKVELNDMYNIDTRTLATSMLHGIIFDGIQRNPSLTVNDDLAIPYAATLNKFHKYKVIGDYLVSGRISLFPLETLTLDELCFLHRLTSNTVDRFERGDEAFTCQDNSLMPEKSAQYSAQSSCPVKLGNVKTKWGPISVSNLLAGIAAGLQQEQVTFQKVVDAISMHKARSYSSANTRSKHVDSVLFGTLIGDLADVLLSQASSNPVIGNTGYWNDSMLPRTFYLDSQDWDLTEAEVLGGIDGTVLGKKAANLLTILDSTRLSQILDMYYSDRGIPYEFNFKVTDRQEALDYLYENANISNQIYGATQLLRAIRSNYELTITENYITHLSLVLGEYFKTSAGSIVNNYDKIEYVSGNRMLANLELIIILDGSFDSYTTQQIIAGLSEAVDVSYYGSQVGIINGQNGKWITNVTREIFGMFQTFELIDQQGTWPSTLNLSASLATVNAYYQYQTQVECNSTALSPTGRAILTFSKNGMLTESDVTGARKSIQAIKRAYPETVMIYVSQDLNGTLKELSQNDDDSVVNSSSNALSTVTKIVEKLSVIPGSLIKFYCNHSDVRFQDYFTPGQENVFQIHREYIKRGFVTTKFMNKDYGDLSICVFTSRTSQNNRECQPLTVNSEISFNSGSLCSPDSACDLRYSLTANNTQIKCAEKACRYPDQVLVTMTYTFSSATALSKTCSFVLLTAWLIILN